MVLTSLRAYLGVGGYEFDRSRTYFRLSAKILATSRSYGSISPCHRPHLSVWVAYNAFASFVESIRLGTSGALVRNLWLTMKVCS